MGIAMLQAFRAVGLREAVRSLLLEHGGFLYASDASGDDLPFHVTVGVRRHLVLPYSFDINDMHLHPGLQRFVTGAVFAEYVIDAFEHLWDEGGDTPRMLSVGLHLRTIGRLRRVLRHMRAWGQVWMAWRNELARHWLAYVPP